MTSKKELFFDDNHNTTTEDNATLLIIQNYDKKGRLQDEKWMRLKK